MSPLMLTKQSGRLRWPVIALLALLGLGMFSAPAQAQPMTMAQLLAGGSITVDDKLFFNFRGFNSFATGGAAPVNPATILVTGIFDVVDGPGLSFQSAAFFVTSGQTQDTVFFFDVLVLTPGVTAIVDNSLELIAFAVSGDGRISIAETVVDENGAFVTSKLVFLDPPAVPIIKDVKTFGPQDFLSIRKDIGLSGGASGAAFLSDFDQQFSQIVIPEPATLTMAGLGILGVVGYGWRRRRFAKAA